MSDADRLAARTLELVDVASESREEAAVLASIRAAMPAERPLLDDGDGVLFYAGREDAAPAIVLAGHVDTVPAQGNHPGSRDESRVVGLGSTDMKGGLAVMLELAADPSVDAGFLFFAREEIPIAESALIPLLERSDGAKAIELAIMLEPTDNKIEIGCLGNLNATVTFRGISAHSARPWHGDNAAHAAIRGLARAAGFDRRDVIVDGLLYREVMNVTMLDAGIAQNVLPETATAHVNFRYAPGRTPDEALDELHSFIPDAELEVVGNAPPGPVPEGNAHLDRLRTVVGLEPRPKQAWTPVAEFGMFGVDAVNLGPGDPSLAHRADESVSVAALARSHELLRTFLAKGEA